MTATLIEPDLLDALDFEYVPACEHALHDDYHVIDQPAKYVVENVNERCCDFGEKILLCESGWAWLCSMTFVTCDKCGTFGFVKDFIRIVTTI